MNQKEAPRWKKGDVNNSRSVNLNDGTEMDGDESDMNESRQKLIESEMESDPAFVSGAKIIMANENAIQAPITAKSLQKDGIMSSHHSLQKVNNRIAPYNEGRHTDIEHSNITQTQSQGALPRDPSALSTQFAL